MGAFGSCLGVGRPMRPNDARLIGTSLVPVDMAYKPNGSGQHMMRGNMNNFRGGFVSLEPSMMANGKSPGLKLTRQSSSMSNGGPRRHHGLPLLDKNNNNSPKIDNKLVDVDDTPLSPFDKPLKQNSHSNCNRNKQIKNNIIQESSLDSPEAKKAAIALTRQIAPQKIVTLRALYPYEARTKDDLSFDKGEIFETIESSLKNPQWWIVKSKKTGKLGYVPSNFVENVDILSPGPWYSSHITRSEAEAQLKSPENLDGAFIVRVSQGSHCYSLSVKHEDQIKHYKIKNENGRFTISSKKSFATLQELVAHYSLETDGLCINLRKACVFVSPNISEIAPYIRDRWEVEKSDFKLGKELGHGQFGQVFEAIHNESQTRVAIKTLKKDSMPLQDFLAEAQIMKNMDHPNLVKLMAVSTREEPVYIITELMCKGALINYLQTGEGKNLLLKDYINMAAQIADGMTYLERKKYVHRDLAARNILVGERNICKIADFGLARFIQEQEYEARVGAKFPIKWTAPEAANYSKFTIKSDVWSFGIVLYEIITKGGIPYPDMTNVDVVARIDNGYRMPQPLGCEDKYYRIMSSCWQKDPNKRPAFETLLWQLRDYFMSDEQYREATHFIQK